MKWLIVLLLLPFASAHYHFESANVVSPHTGDGVIVAVLDGGVTSPHLVDSMWKNAAETDNGIDDDLNGWTDDVHGWDTCEDRPYQGRDFDGHGTGVAGAIAGPIGVAPDATIMRVKVRCEGDVYPSVRDDLDLEGLREGIEYATVNGADIIVMSLQNWPDNPHGQIAALLQLEDEFQAAEEAGVLLVAATGNNKEASASSPANHPLVFAVGALTACDTPASYSNGGANIWAPGEVLTLDTTHDYVTWNGTSFAAPMVAGAAALLLEEQDRSPQELRDALRGNVVRGRNILDVGGLFGSPRQLQNGSMSYLFTDAGSTYSVPAEYYIQFAGHGFALEMQYSEAGRFCIPAIRFDEYFLVRANTFSQHIELDYRAYPGEWKATTLVYDSSLANGPVRPVVIDQATANTNDAPLSVVVVLAGLVISLTLRKRK